MNWHPSERGLSRWPIALLAMLAAISACVVSCSKRELPSESPVLARVGDRVITIADFEREVARRLKTARRSLPDKESILQEMIDREAALCRAERAKLDEDPEVKRMLENLLIGQLRDRELDAKLREARVSDDEIRQEYENQISHYTRPEKVRLAILKLNLSPGMSETKRAEVRARIEAARRRVQENPAPGGRGAAATGFGALAIEYSEDQASRYRGGDIGWLNAGSYEYHWPRSVLEVGYALEPGDVSDVIKTGEGLYLTIKTDHRERTVTPFEEVEESLRQKALARKRVNLKEAFRAETIRLATTEIDREVLQSVSLPTDASHLAGGRELEPPALPDTN